MAERKTGTLNNEAQAFIRANSGKMPPEQIAEHIQKTKATVTRYIAKHRLPKYGETYEEQTWRRLNIELEKEVFWQGIINNYTEDEINIFRAKWISLMLQFQQDVTETEKLQIHKYLTLFLLRERAVCKQTLFQRTLESVSAQLDDVRRKSPDDRNDALVDKLATTVQSLTKESKDITREIADLSKQESEVEKALKGTRDQRIKLINDATKNFSSIMELLESPATRRELGLHIELHKAAADKAYEDISQPHKYMNGTYDLPLLTSETVHNLELEE